MGLVFVQRYVALLGLLGVTASHVAVDPQRPASGGPPNEAPTVPFTVPAAPIGQRGEPDEGAAALPVLMIDADGRAIGKDRETLAALRVIEEHDGTLQHLARSEASVESRVSLEVHGDSSATLAKKSYRLELIDDAQKARDLPLLGLPPGSDWVLHSCGFDPSCMRNALVYTLGRALGHYAPRTRFVELFVDGVYHGLYVLIERVRRDDHRVHLPKPARRAADGDVTGGYIFKMDLGEGAPADTVPRDWVSPVSQTVYSYYYPRPGEITAAQKAYLHDHVSRFEAAMRSRPWSDAQGGYRQWLHLPSWVDFALIQELSLNPDAYFKSVYLQKWPRSMGDLIAIGPFWDFDLAFGVVDFRGGRNLQAWAHQMNRFGGERVAYDPPGESPYVPEFWERLWDDPAFQQRLRCRWHSLRTGVLRLDRLEALIDGWLEELAVALPRDWERWKDLPKNSFHGDGDNLKAFIGKRVAWMDANLPGQCG